jgi:hypothetical protein
MNFAKRLLMAAGAVALAGTFGALLAPKAAHALIATLVQVANTPSQPVPVKDVQSPIASPFDIEQPCTFSGTEEPCSQQLLATSANQVAKIEYESVFCELASSASSLIRVSLDFNNNDHELTVPGPTVNGAIHFGQAMNIYVPPGTTVFATFEVFPLAPNGGRCFMTINGFLAPQ